MSRMNRRRFTWVATSGIASAALVACSGDAVDEDLTPTQIPDAAGAPPTLAPNATPFSSDEGGGEEAAAAGGGDGGPVTVTAVDIGYEPTELSIPPDTDVEIHVVNDGALQHDFVIEETDFATELLNGGEEATITVNLPEGEYTYFCSVPGHREAGMEGTLTVSADAAAAGSAEEEGSEEAAAGGGGGPVTVNAVDIAFEPTEFSIPADTDVEIHVVNEGALQHDFNIEETDFATAMLNSGEEETITVNLPEGEYVYFCSVPGHREAGMEGTLTVSADAGGAAAAEEGGEEAATAEEGGDEAAAAGGGGEPVTVTAVDIAFEPTSFEVAPGQDIHVVNDGSLQHDFVVDGMDLATELLDGGGEETITVPEDAEPGDYTFYCSVPGHREAGMEGTMTITDGGGAAASGETEEGETAAGASDEAAAAAASGEAVTVEAFDSLQYEPAEFSVVPGQTITVINRGTLQHDFVVDEWGLATPLLNRDEEAQLTVPADAEAGQSFTFYCSVPGHQAAGMEGTLTVGEGEAAPAEATEEAPADDAAEGTPAEAQGEQLDANVIHVSALDSMRFAPSQFSAAPGQQVHLVNVGVLVHDIVVDEWGLDSGPLEGNAETTFRIPDDAEVGSEHEFYCSVPGHRESGMVGTITIIEADVRQAEAVTPAAEASPAAESATPADEGDAAAVATPAEEAASGNGGGGGDAETLEVTTVDIAFEPTELTMPADTDVEVHVVNEGALQHDFVVEDTDFATELLNSGDEETITVNLPAGEYTYFCSVPGHREAGMEGTLTVE